MNEMLKALYDSFYKKLLATQLKSEIERCHQELIEKLDIEKVRIYRDYQFEVDLKPTVKEFKALWSKRSAQSANGAA